jgi:peroxiredoxin
VLLAGVVAGGVLVWQPWSEQSSPSLVQAVADLDGEWVGRQAPSFKLPDLNGQTHRLTEYRGEVVFLNFWASYCAPCRREMPSMERLIRQYKGRGLEMLAVSLDQKRAEADKFLDKFLSGRRSAMTVLWDPASEVSRRFGTEKIPETYIIDREGRIVARFVNDYDWTRPEVKQLVEALL